MSTQNKLEQKIAEFKSLELAKSHLNQLEERLKDNYIKLEKFNLVLEKEYKDVEQLEQLSMRALFKKILGDKEAQLEKERQDYLIAALNYNECKKSIELLEFEKEVLIKKLDKFDETKSEMFNLIRQRENSLMREDDLANQLLKDLNTKIDNNIGLKRELHEAITLGLRINRVLKDVIQNLKKVTQWGEYELHSPDSHIRKMVYINKARDQSYIAKQLLQEFEDELKDIYNDQNLYILSSLKTFKYFIRSFFDNLISDWVVLIKIKNSLSTIHQVNDKVTRITKSLQFELKKIEKEQEILSDKKNKIIIELN